MYKINLFLLVLFTAPNSLYGQMDTIKVSDGLITKVVLLEDNPWIVPKWEINIQPFTLKVNPAAFLGFHLQPRYRFTQKITVSIPVTIAYWKRTDFQKFRNNLNGFKTAYPEQLRTRTIDVRMIGHLTLKNTEKQKIKQFNLKSDFKWENAKVKKLKTILADFGIGYNRSGSVFSINNTSPSAFHLQGIKWNGGAIDNVEAILGISTENSSSTYLELEGVQYYHYKINRFYANMSISFVNKYDIYGVDFYNNINDPFNVYGDVTYEIVPKNETSNIITSVPIGWRAGYTFNKNIKNSPLSLTFGGEIGKYAGYKRKGVNVQGWLVHFNSAKHSNPAYFKLRFGFSFGAKTKFSRRAKKSIVKLTSP